MYQKLFEKGKIGSLTIKNRLVMSPMGIGLAELDGSPSEDMIAFYEARAKGGAGLIIPEITRINDVHGAGLMRQLSVTKDRHIEPLSRLADTIHKYDCKIFIQLHHPGRETKSVLIGGQPVVAPSAIMCKVSQQKTRALENSEIKELVQQFIAGAVRVKKAGCDGVELHAAHGYLIQQFLSPYTNKRTDEYGGSFENRMRFITEIIQGIRKECGDFPISVRLSVEEFLDKTGVTEDYIHIQDGVKIAMALEKLGIDVINVSCGLYETATTCVEPTSFPQGWRRNLIKAVKDHVKIPVIGVSVIREPAVAEKFLEDGVEDFVSMGRSWLADEEWGKKAFEGRDKEIRKCISCLRCFQSLAEYNAAGMPPECCMNPRMGRERKYGELIKDEGNHKVVVVGAGPAGMSAAKTLAERGIKVTLIDKEKELGGQINVAKQPPYKERMKWIGEYYKAVLDKLGVDIKLNTEATAESILAFSPDAVILATGATPLVPRSIKGIKGDNVYSVEDVLSGKKVLENKNVVLIGAGMTGIETAEYLGEKGNKVTVIDMLDKVAPEANQTNVFDVTSRLKKQGTKFLLGHKLLEITKDSVIVENKLNNEKVTLPSQAVVLSLGYLPNRALEAELKNKCDKVYVIGDAEKIGIIAPATRSGFEVAKDLFVKKNINSFHVTESEMKDFAAYNRMGNQEGVYMCYLTDPAAIKNILPPGLEPFMMPVVTLSVTHVNNPSFSEDYYETILGCYATHKGNLGLYCIALVLGGKGQEMATQLGREVCGIPKKLNADFNINRDGSHVSVTVDRKGTRLVDINMELGAYNHPMAGVLYQNPTAGKQTYGSGMYYIFDKEYDKENKLKFSNVRLYKNMCQYTYKSWEPGFAKLKLNSSIDDPWAELPINTIIGGAYCKNDLIMQSMELVEEVDAEKAMPYLLKSRFDKVVFMGNPEKK